MKTLNGFVALAPLNAKSSGLQLVNSLSRFVVKATNDSSALKVQDVVLCPTNAGVDFEGLKIVDEKQLFAQFK